LSIDKKNMNALVNGRQFSNLEAGNEGFTLNGQKHDWDIQKLPDGRYHLIIDGQNHLAEILDIDQDKKTFRIKFNGHLFEIQLFDQFDRLLQKMGMTGLNSSSVKGIKAPMPGLIVKINVKEGDSIEKGAPLLILKAMKMENIIKSPDTLKIKKVMIREGQAVEKNQDLILF